MLFIFFILVNIGQMFQTITPFYDTLENMMARYPDMARHFGDSTHEEYIKICTICLY